MPAFEPDTQVAIVGAGLAGLCAAWALDRHGIEAVVVDRAASRSTTFRAEKIEPFQSRLLRKLELLDVRRPLAGPIERVLLWKDGRLSTATVGEQYGIRYHDTVNELRRRVETRVPVRQSRVESVVAGDELQRLEFADGGSLSARVVILATGGASGLASGLGMRHASPRTPLRSLAFGFDVARSDDEPFPFRGLNCRPPVYRDGVEYVTLFLIGDTMRANLYTLWRATDPRVQELRSDVVPALERLFPGMHEHAGPLRVTSRIEVCPTEYYRLRGVERPGVVALGDEFQSTSPASGTGLGKVLADVDALCNRHLPRWLDSRGMGTEKTARFYRDPFKRQVDEWSRAEWAHASRMASHPFVARPLRILWRLRHRPPR